MMNTTNEAPANDTTIPVFTSANGTVAEVTGDRGWWATYRVGHITIVHDRGRSIRVTDRTNAGRRGLTCPTLYMWASNGSMTMDRLSEIVDAAGVGFAKVVEVATFCVSLSDGMGVQVREEKAARTAPARFDRFTYCNQELAVGVDFDTFTISDLTDPMNEPRTIPHGNADKNKCPRIAAAFRAHLREHRSIDRQAASNIFARVGVVGHSYCAVD